jgi:hypothetical protein
MRGKMGKVIFPRSESHPAGKDRMRKYALAFLVSAPLIAFCLGACDLSSAINGGNGSKGGDGATSLSGGRDETALPAVEAGAPLAKDADGRYFRSDLEDQDSSCWGNRSATGYAKTGCGSWGYIGSSGIRLARGGVSRSGTKAFEVTFAHNEDVGGASLGLSAEVVDVRAYYYFDQGFDFGQGIKIGRISSFNETTRKNDIDIIMTVRSADGADQCGLNDMADIGLFYNGAPAGSDWGNLIAPMRFERGKWYAVEYQVALNAPGKADGSVKLWVEGALASARTGLDIRGREPASTKLNRIRIGGWYSNSARRNPCPDPSQASTLFIDDVAVGSDFLGLD